MGTDGNARALYAKELLCVVFRRKRFIGWTFLVIFGGVSLAVLLAPARYQAAVILMVSRDRGEVLSTPNLASRLKPRANGEAELYSATELLTRRSLIAEVVEILGSRAVLSQRLPSDQARNGNGADESLGRRAARYLQTGAGLAPSTLGASGNRDAGAETGESVAAKHQAILAVSSGLKVVPIATSNLITISFTADDPRYAATVLEVLVAKYLEQYAQLRVTPGPADFFGREVDRLAKELREAEDALQRFEAEQKISSFDHQRDSYLKNALDRESALQLTRSEVEELREKGRVLRQQLQKLPEKVRTTEELRANPVLDTIRSRLLDLELERNKLLQKLSAPDRRMDDIEREIAVLREQFLSESAWAFAGETYGQNPVRSPLMTDLMNTEAQLIRTEARAKNLERDMNDFHTRLRHLDRLASERTRLERKVKTLQETYLLYRTKYEEARISSALDQSQVADVRLAEPIQVSVAARLGGMGGLPLALLGAVAGVLSGIAGAFSREYFEQSFSTEESVRRRLGLPVLTSILEEDV